MGLYIHDWTRGCMYYKYVSIVLDMNLQIIRKTLICLSRTHPLILMSFNGMSIHQDMLRI